MAKNRKNRDNDSLVYTTNESGNPFFNDLFVGDDETESTPKSKMVVRVSRDRKNRGGKEVSLVQGLDLSDDDLNVLAKLLKSKCGVGGSAKEGEIIVQGNHVDKIVQLLIKEGFTNTKRKGG